MKVILTERVRSLGSVGEIVNVSAGHARNYLIPNNLAVLADEGNKKLLNDQQRRLAKKVAEQKAEAESLKKKIDGLVIELVKKVGGNGTLFGTVTNTELSKELAAKDIDVERRLIVIENPIKTLGTFDIEAKLFTDVVAKFQVKVVIDPKQAEEMKKKQEAAAAKKAKKETEEKSKDESEAEKTTEETES